jgi:hypothetical protein
MNQEIDIENAESYDIFKHLKKTGNVTFIMSRKEEKLFKKGCKSLDFMYKSMDMRGSLLNQLFKLFTVPIIWLTVKILNWYRALGHECISKALLVYELSWHEMDFVQVKEKSEDELYVHFFWLKKV